MSEALTVLLFVLLPPGWIATGVLFSVARQRPLIPVLAERAVLAVGCSVAATVYVLVAANTDLGFRWFPFEDAVVIVRLIFVGLAAFPLIWLALYFRGRLGGSE